MVPERLQKYVTNPIKVLDDGFVRLVDVMGDDNTIVSAARVSHTVKDTPPKNTKALIYRMMRDGHTVPFEHCEISLHIRLPLDVMRQHIRHRTFSTVEYSTRYGEAINSVHMYTEETFRSVRNPTELPSQQDASLYKTAVENSRAVYNTLLANGRVREQARSVLPLGTYTEIRWKGNLHNLFHYLSKRLTPHAQQEIRLYGEAILQIIKDWVPIATAAFFEYKVNAITLSNTLKDFLVQWIEELVADTNDPVEGLLRFINTDNEVKARNHIQRLLKDLSWED